MQASHLFGGRALKNYNGYMERGRFIRMPELEIGENSEYIQEQLARSQRDASALEERREALLEEYPGQWIAFFDGRVVGIGPDILALRAEVRERQHLPEGEVSFTKLEHVPHPAVQ